MNKEKWVRPQAVVQVFTANEYIAACYKIQCRTPNNNSSYNWIYKDNGDGVFDVSKDTIVYGGTRGTSFSGCNQWHKGVILDEAPSANGWVVRRNWNGYTADPVFYWQENLGTQYEGIHVMTPGDESYETNKNAS